MNKHNATAGVIIIAALIGIGILFFAPPSEAALVPKYLTATAYKAGVAASGDFSGNPKKATITFTTAFPDANYSLTVIGIDERTWSYESPAAGSIVINSGNNSALSGNVLWVAIQHADP